MKKSGIFRRVMTLACAATFALCATFGAAGCAQECKPGCDCAKCTEKTAAHPAGCTCEKCTAKA